MTTLLNPPSIIQSLEDTILTIQSDAFSLPSAAYFVYEIQQDHASIVGDTLTFKFNEFEQFVFVFTDDNTSTNPLSLPIRTGQSEAEYLVLLAEHFQANRNFADSLDVKIGVLANSLFFISKSCNLIDSSIMTTVQNVAINFFEATNNNDLEYCYLRGQNTDRGFARTGAFNTDKVSFEIKAFAENLNPFLPFLGNAFLKQQASGITDVVTIKYAVGEEKMKRHELYSIYGRNARAYSSQKLSLNRPFSSLHGSSTKTNREQQIDYWYVYSSQDSLSAMILTCYNAENEVVLKKTILEPDQFDENTVYVFHCGHGQMQSLMPEDTVRYTIAITSEDGTGVFIGREYFIVQKEEGILLLHSNGLGGCETFFYGGETKMFYTEEKEEFLSLNKLEMLAKRYAYGFELNTTYNDSLEEVLLHFDCINEPAWLVDTENGIFKPLINTTKEYELDLKNPPYSINFTFKNATNA